MVLPGETVTLHFGFCFSNSSGFRYCDWKLRVHPSHGVATSATAAGLHAADAAATATIAAVAVAAVVPLPLEGLWQHRVKVLRWQALDAAEDALRQLLQHVYLCLPEAKGSIAGANADYAGAAHDGRRHCCCYCRPCCRLGLQLHGFSSPSRPVFSLLAKRPLYVGYCDRRNS